MYVNSGFLDDGACRRIRAAMDVGVAEPGEILGDSIVVAPAVRRASSIEVDAGLIAEIEGRIEAERAALEDFFARALGEREGVNLLRYEAGGFYRPHRDRGAVASWPAAAERCVSVVVFLNQEFSGGALALHDPDPRVIEPRTGQLVAFASDVLHEVLSVRTGTRDTLVDWFLSARLRP